MKLTINEKAVVNESFDHIYNMLHILKQTKETSNKERLKEVFRGWILELNNIVHEHNKSVDMEDVSSTNVIEFKTPN